jgi:hypothetical protein
MGTGWLEGLFWRVQSEEESKKLGRAGVAVDLVSVAEEHAHFETSAMAVANELATRLQCDRVTVGFRIGNRIRLRAMSHSAWFEPRSQLVTGLENAMEEAFDQSATIYARQTHERPHIGAFVVSSISVRPETLHGV